MRAKCLMIIKYRLKIIKYAVKMRTHAEVTHLIRTGFVQAAISPSFMDSLSAHSKEVVVDQFQKLTFTTLVMMEPCTLRILIKVRLASTILSQFVGHHNSMLRTHQMLKYSSQNGNKIVFLK